MSSQQVFSRKNLGGRPAIGSGTQINVMLRPGMVRALDAYCEQTGLRRTDAVRSLLKLGLKAYNDSLSLQDES
jgi:hypothetical protein